MNYVSSNSTDEDREVKAKTYQVPKANHPWRNYADRKIEIEVRQIKEKKIKAVKVFITELSEGWDTMEVVTTAFGREDRFKLTDLPQAKQAAWLAGILKRNYSNGN